MFMTCVVISFMLNSSTLGAGLPMTVSTIAGLVTTAIIATMIIIKTKGKGDIDTDEEDKVELANEL